MGFKETMSRFGKSVQNTANDITEKSKLAIEKSKIKNKISTEQGTLNSKYIEVGKKAYELFKENPTEEFAELMQDINTSLNAIEQLNVELVALDGTVKCENCGGEVGKDEAFCSKCGAKVVVPEVPKDVIEPIETENAEVIPTESTSTIPTETTYNQEETKSEE